MALSQRSSQNSTKKQQSISNFFTKNLPSKKLDLVPSSSDSADPILLEENYPAENESLFVSPGNDVGGSPTSQQQCETSKRAFDDGESNAQTEGDSPRNQPARKRPRTLDSEENGHVHKSYESPNAGDSLETQKLRAIAANRGKAFRPSDQTSKYVFSDLPLSDHESPVDDDSKRRKEILHQKFVKKLGNPDSIAEIKRRYKKDFQETIDEELDPDDMEDDEESPTHKITIKGKKGIAAKKGVSKLTPMDKQFLSIKRDYLDSVLVVEVGYKFKFFGEDARIAAKELSIVCIPGKLRYDEHFSEAHLDRFASASFPVHRLHVHVKRLVGAGYKVGIVRQVETAALKAAGDNRSGPFVRKLTNLYTKGTYIDDVEGLDGSLGGPSGGAPATGHLLCITESNAMGWGTDEKVHVGIVAVQPATGDVIYDDFEDGFMRSEIETRLLHVAPCEILIVGQLSKATDKLVQHLSGSKKNIFGEKIRVERVERPKTMAAQAYSHVSNFYAGKMKASDLENDERASKLLENVLKMAEDVTICLSAMITHMSDYGLEHVFDLTEYFQSFSARSHMVLNGTSLTSLEIYQNQTDHREKGSLFWTLDRTKTRFGQRLLRKWVGRPLLIQADLEERIAAVEELKSGEKTIKVDKLTHLLSHIKTDLEKSLIRIYYGKVNELTTEVLT